MNATTTSGPPTERTTVKPVGKPPAIFAVVFYVLGAAALGFGVAFVGALLVHALWLVLVAGWGVVS
jgi:hypothetical protein